MKFEHVADRYEYGPFFCQEEYYGLAKDQLKRRIKIRIESL